MIINKPITAKAISRALRGAGMQSFRLYGIGRSRLLHYRSGYTIQSHPHGFPERQSFSVTTIVGKQRNTTEWIEELQKMADVLKAAGIACRVITPRSRFECPQIWIAN